MPYKIRKRGSKWCVVGPNKTHGCHTSKAKAERQRRAIEANEASEGSDTVIVMETDSLAATATVTIEVDEEQEDQQEELVEEVAWEGILGLEGAPTGDRRYLMPGELTDRDLPLPFMVRTSNDEGHKGAENGGRIESISRIPLAEFDKEGFELEDLPDSTVVIWAQGHFDGSQAGQDAVRLMENGGGVSLDLAVTEVVLLDEDTLEPVDEEELDLLDILFGGGSFVTGIKGQIMGATVLPFQAFDDAQIRVITASGTAHMWSHFGFTFIRPVLTASAAGKAPLNPPKSWFETPETDIPCPLTVTEDGRVFGHLAVWGQCHTGFENICQQPPRSFSDYQFFHLGEIDTAEGDCISVGKITVGTPHAPLTYGSQKTQEHYDNTGCVAAFVRAQDGRRGIWLSGAIRSDVPAEKIRDLRANPPSGDWRRENGALELQGVLSVPIPGYPVPRSEARLVASGGLEEVEALVATVNVDEMVNWRKRKRKKAMLAHRLRQALGEKNGNSS